MHFIVVIWAGAIVANSQVYVTYIVEFRCLLYFYSLFMYLCLIVLVIADMLQYNEVDLICTALCETAVRGYGHQFLSKGSGIWCLLDAI